MINSIKREMEYIKKLKVKFYLRTNSKKQNGSNAVMLRVGYDGVWVAFGSTGCFATPAIWSGGNFVGRSKVALNGREALRVIEENIKIQFREYYHKADEFINLYEFRSIWQDSLKTNKRVLKERITFRKCLQAFIDNCKSRANANLIRKSTYKNTTTLVRCLAREFKSVDSDIRLITQKDVEDYQMQLLIDGFAAPSVNSKTTLIKSVFAFALDNDWISRNPSKNLGKVKEPKKIKRLTEDELNRFLSCEIDSHLVLFRDIFEFMCITGMAFADAFKLKKKDIVHTPEGDFIEKERQKSSVPYCIPLIARANEIIEKYAKNSNTPVFPKTSNTNFNSKLNEIAKAAKIDRKLTSHMGRYTFASLAINNGVSLETMRRIMGHTNIEMTECYGRMENEKITTDLYRLENKLKERITTWK